MDMGPYILTYLPFRSAKKLPLTFNCPQRHCPNLVASAWWGKTTTSSRIPTFPGWFIRTRSSSTRPDRRWSWPARWRLKILTPTFWPFLLMGLPCRKGLGVTILVKEAAVFSPVLDTLLLRKPFKFLSKFLIKLINYLCVKGSPCF